jgi:hypothetical protein
VIELRTGTRIWIAAGYTDLRRGFQGLTTLVETVLEQAPYSGHVFVFRGKRGDLIKLLWWDVTDYVCSRSGWSAGASSDRRQPAVRSLLHERSYRCCWRGSIGGSRSERGNHKQQDKWVGFRRIVFRFEGSTLSCSPSCSSPNRGPQIRVNTPSLRQTGLL